MHADVKYDYVYDAFHIEERNLTINTFSDFTFLHCATLPPSDWTPQLLKSRGSFVIKVSRRKIRGNWVHPEFSNFPLLTLTLFYLLAILCAIFSPNPSSDCCTNVSDLINCLLFFQRFGHFWISFQCLCVCVYLCIWGPVLVCVCICVFVVPVFVCACVCLCICWAVESLIWSTLCLVIERAGQNKEDCSNVKKLQGRPSEGRVPPHF